MGNMRSQSVDQAGAVGLARSLRMRFRDGRGRKIFFSFSVTLAGNRRGGLNNPL